MWSRCYRPGRTIVEPDDYISYFAGALYGVTNPTLARPAAPCFSKSSMTF